MVCVCPPLGLPLCNADFPVGTGAGWKTGVTPFLCGSRAQSASFCSGNYHPDPLPPGEETAFFQFRFLNDRSSN